MENWAVVFGIVGAIGGLVALADRLRKRGQQDAGLAFEGMTTLASELRREIERKTKEWSDELKAERQECDDRIRRLREDIVGLEGRVKTVEDANGL